jgi:hypothetical protein
MGRLKNIYSVSGGRSEGRNVLRAVTAKLAVCWHVMQLRMEVGRFSDTLENFYHRPSYSRK